jgi:Gpi18-like mannosyltransferase
MYQLMQANYWFASAPSLSRTFYITPHWFTTLWAVLYSIAPSLNRSIKYLTQQDIGDFLFSLSREYARRLPARSP